MAGAFILVSDIGGGKAFAEINTSGGFLKLFNEYREACRIAGFGFTTIPRKGNAGSVSSVNKLTEELKKVGIEFQLDPTLNTKGVEGMKKLDARSAFVKFMKGENITVVSLGSGNKFTFGWEGGKVYTRKPDEFFIGDLRDSTAEFIGVGCPGSKAFEFTLRKLRENLIPKGMEIWGDSAVLVAQAMPVAVAMEPTFKASLLQQAIIDAIRAGKNVEVRAGAGCGKTTVILAAAAYTVGKRVTYCAFNGDIVGEMKGKAPSHMDVRTLNSYGFRIVKSVYGNYIPVKKLKTNLIVEELVDLSKMAKEESKVFLAAVSKLVSLAKGTLSDTDDDTLNNMAFDYDVNVGEGDPSFIFQTVRQVMKESLPNGVLGKVVDFDDQIWWPHILGLGCPTNDYVFVDEAQDLNAAQHSLMMKASAKCRLIMVGDPFQAIYAFRGADSSSMDTLRDAMKAAGRTMVSLPLNETRRVPKIGVRLVNSLWPEIAFKSLPEAPEGELFGATEDGDIFGVDQLDAKVGDMVLCRKNAPLVPEVFRLLRMGISAKIRGKDIGDGFINLVHDMKAKSIEDLIDKLSRKLDKEIKRVEKRYSKASQGPKLDEARELLEDKFGTLIFLAEEQESIDDLKRAIGKLFSDDKTSNDVVLFSTVHKAKGLEAKRVHILMTSNKKQPSAGSAQADQERNIMYVAVTRFIESLTFVKEKKKDIN